MKTSNYYISELLDMVDGSAEDKIMVFEAVKERTEDDIHTLCIVTEATGDYTVNEIMNNLEQLDYYEVEYSVHTPFDLGRYWMKNMVTFTGENAWYLNYVDYEWLGKDLEASGVATTTAYGALWHY